ncbi:hypothetical protein BX661DRAFT_187585 [Kickxella alabastrina]|uniref:uncharacterized protein n=1 Tax=Kickxella alabastrina TaxID=61397 RepID=UPI00221F77F6|nr:uncharacterized protein BX661DRAFT_187585 [Kickxella alabastrina]KAI7822262.1 hypothetical protein BX661DRAFT_187585 [Kickxella alabastrina]KAJ1947342.1 hypothetical protein GGF37_000524 [Kickxella alabastrina]
MEYNLQDQAFTYPQYADEYDPNEAMYIPYTDPNIGSYQPESSLLKRQLEPKTTKKKQASKIYLRLNSRTKTPWTIDENISLFRTMAEYIYVKKTGMKPLAIYLNPSELNHVVTCEKTMAMNDSEIAVSLREQEIESNPSRRGDLLFAVVRHLQYSSGFHETRVVNEKIKNVRSRIINEFMTMFNEGTLPTKRPVRYVTAMLNNLVTSPFANLDSSFGSNINLGNAPGAADNKHDVSLWLAAMFWLHAKDMYDFVYQCALQVVRTQARLGTPACCTAELQDQLEQPSPDLCIIVSQLYAIISYLNANTRGAKDKDKAKGPNAATRNGYGDAENSSKKRKRKALTPLDVRKKPPMQETMVICNDNKLLSLTMFEILKNEEKLQIAGMRVKMVASVGGVIRRTNGLAIQDIKYHMYRLWTCVSRFNDISPLLKRPNLFGDNIIPNIANFAEFVVVDHFANPFSNTSVEPSVRVSKQRRFGHNMNIELLIEQKFAATQGENRSHIPVWLTICRRSDDRYVFALIITSADKVAPVESQIGGFNFTRFPSESFLSSIDNAIASGGNVNYQGVPMCQHAGLEPWPWSPNQVNTLTASYGYEEKVGVKMQDGSTVIVSSGWANTAHTLEPWAEPRVLSTEAYSCQQGYAGALTVGTTPCYEQLLNAAHGISNQIVDASLPNTASIVPHQYINVGGNSNILATLAHSENIQPLSAQYVNVGGSMDFQPMMPTSNMILSNTPLMTSPQNFPIDIINEYGSNDWVTGNYNRAGNYQ